jgi:hypothetical protein
MSSKKKKLSDEILEQIKKVIGEDDTKKSQMLKQFREWIEKHPRIKNVRKGKIDVC